jgi:chromosome segregation ATPase
MNSLQRELQTLTEQIEEQDDLLRPLEKEVEKAEKKASKECVRDDATLLGKEIWKELDGLSDDLQKCRASATTALRAASRQVSTKRLRVRLRLSGRVVKEPKPIHVVTSKGQRAAVEAIVQASQELDACRDVGAYARRSMRRLTQCARNRIKVVESQRPGPLPQKPVIADAEAAFASAGLKTPDAVEDCLVCWDFMATFRAAAASFHAVGATRLQE